MAKRQPNKPTECESCGKLDDLPRDENRDCDSCSVLTYGGLHDPDAKKFRCRSCDAPHVRTDSLYCYRCDKTARDEWLKRAKRRASSKAPRSVSNQFIEPAQWGRRTRPGARKVLYRACAWCSQALEGVDELTGEVVPGHQTPPPGQKAESHGICPPCARRMLTEAGLEIPEEFRENPALWWLTGLSPWTRTNPTKKKPGIDVAKELEKRVGHTRYKGAGARIPAWKSRKKSGSKMPVDPSGSLYPDDRPVPKGKVFTEVQKVIDAAAVKPTIDGAINLLQRKAWTLHAKYVVPAMVQARRSLGHYRRLWPGKIPGGTITEAKLKKIKADLTPKEWGRFAAWRIATAPNIEHPVDHLAELAVALELALAGDGPVPEPWTDKILADASILVAQIPFKWKSPETAAKGLDRAAAAALRGTKTRRPNVPASRLLKIKAAELRAIADDQPTVDWMWKDRGKKMPEDLKMGGAKKILKAVDWPEIASEEDEVLRAAYAIEKGPRRYQDLALEFAWFEHGKGIVSQIPDRFGTPWSSDVDPVKGHPGWMIRGVMPGTRSSGRRAVFVLSHRPKTVAHSATNFLVDSELQIIGRAGTHMKPRAKKFAAAKEKAAHQILMKSPDVLVALLTPQAFRIAAERRLRRVNESGSIIFSPAMTMDPRQFVGDADIEVVWAGKDQHVRFRLVRVDAPSRKHPFYVALHTARRSQPFVLDLGNGGIVHVDFPEQPKRPSVAEKKAFLEGMQQKDLEGLAPAEWVFGTVDLPEKAQRSLGRLMKKDFPPKTLDPMHTHAGKMAKYMTHEEVDELAAAAAKKKKKPPAKKKAAAKKKPAKKAKKKKAPAKKKVAAKKPAATKKFSWGPSPCGEVIQALTRGALSDAWYLAAMADATAEELNKAIYFTEGSYESREKGTRRSQLKHALKASPKTRSTRALASRANPMELLVLTNPADPPEEWKSSGGNRRNPIGPRQRIQDNPIRSWIERFTKVGRRPMDVKALRKFGKPLKADEEGDWAVHMTFYDTLEFPDRTEMSRDWSPFPELSAEDVNVPINPENLDLKDVFSRPPDETLDIRASEGRILDLMVDASRFAGAGFVESLQATDWGDSIKAVFFRAPLRSSRKNPEAQISAKAQKAYKSFHGAEPAEVKELATVPHPPRELISLGTLDHIGYRVPAHSGKRGNGTPFRHRFGETASGMKKNPKLPQLATDPDGKHLYVIGGEFEVRPEGIVG